MSAEAIYGTELSDIRSWCKENNCFSWTSPEYQRGILDFVLAHNDSGSCVIEVGCYKGGLTALLALLCKKSGLHLYSMDIDKNSAAGARGVLDSLGLSEHATVQHTTLPEFARSTKTNGKPVLCILDGDHAYSAVLQDLKAVEKLQHRPFAVAFHDYSLRHPTTDERVSDAITDFFGSSVSPELIGMRMNGEGHATREAPQPDGHYWQVPGSEGAIVTLGRKTSGWWPRMRFR